LEENGLGETSIAFTEGLLRGLISEYTYEAGVRNLERRIASICRKIARTVAEGGEPPRRVTAAMLNRYLGPPDFIRNLAEEQDGVGIAMGVAWTAGGGDLTPVEVVLMPGKGNLTLTGHLGDIMQESAQAALSYTRSCGDNLDIKPDIFEKTDVHVHLPEGAIPKDGPSAGITIATALISAFTGRAVRHDVGMTGEITLRGRVLPVGGLKEKMLAAYRAGLKTIVIPKRNKKDLVEIPKRVKRKLDIILVEQMDDVLTTALQQLVPTPARRRRPKK
jgi:ATP-dependent Lon protease